MSADPLAFLPSSELSFLEVVDERIARTPNATAITELVLRGTELELAPSTFAAIDTLARGASVRLVEVGIKEGDRVLLAVESPSSFLAWFVAVQRAGAVPVPLPPMSGVDAPAAFVERILRVAGDCSPRCLVVDDERSALALGNAGLDSIARLVASDIEPLDRKPNERSFVPKKSSPAFLQYTSGSTGSPKGVIVTYANLVANFRAIAGGAGFGPSERSLSWLPLYHDMGLIGGFLLGIYMGTEVFVLKTRTFLTRPDCWLRAISRVRATFTVAPNFAYSLVGRKLPDAALRGLDLSSLRLAFNGAEPIDRKTVDAFLERLAPYGLRKDAMYPVYGLAECTLAVAFPRPCEEPRYDLIDRASLYESSLATTSDGVDPLVVISVGRAVPDHRIRILSPDDGRELPERSVGEVVVEGPSVSPGYYGHELENGGGLRTGDLGYFADGDLFLVDRLKDLVIVHGKNYAPSDLERTVAEVPGVTRGAIVAFSVVGTGPSEALIIVAAVDSANTRSSDEIRREVAVRLAERFGLSGATIRLVEAGTIPKTSSGKVRRRECRLQYERNELRDIDGAAHETKKTSDAGRRAEA